jgi:hypothetical protein
VELFNEYGCLAKVSERANILLSSYSAEHVEASVRYRRLPPAGGAGRALRAEPAIDAGVAGDQPVPVHRDHLLDESLGFERI